MSGRVLAAAAAGGAVGALLRHAVAVWLPAEPWGWGTLVANVLGTLLLGLLLRRHLAITAAAFLRTGVLGSFTTFSALMTLTVQGSIGVGLAYLAATLLAGGAAAWLAVPRREDLAA